MSEQANITLPRILKVGSGASGELAATLSALGLSRPLLVTDPHILACGYCGQLQGQLDAAGIPWGLFADCVVGLGGGSSMDTAKALAVLAPGGGEMRDYKVPAQTDHGLPIIAVPTTAGTGSEATRVAVITDTDTGEKMLCMGLGLMPVVRWPRLSAGCRTGGL